MFNPLSEVTALLDENEAESIGDLFHRTTVKPTETSLNSISSTFKTILFTMVLTGLVVSVSVVLLKYTPLLICLYRFLRRNREPTVNFDAQSSTVAMNVPTAAKTESSIPTRHESANDRSPNETASINSPLKPLYPLINQK